MAKVSDPSGTKYFPLLNGSKQSSMAENIEVQIQSLEVVLLYINIDRPTE